jgi:hypothetical protein
MNKSSVKHKKALPKFREGFFVDYSSAKNG